MKKAWYPVIDYTNCIECGACVKKCPHGVYDQEKAPVPVVVNPTECVIRCHGCGNICPGGAITYVGDDTGWTPPKSKAASPAGCACHPDPAKKELVIDFLYLDLSACERCMATDSSLNEALEELAGVFDTLGYGVQVNKVLVDTKEKAREYKFLSSPTIRVNGRDIFGGVRENNCKSCGGLCGDSVDCRVFSYNGRDYDQPPGAMVIEGILRTLLCPGSSEEEAYEIPANLIRFFEGRKSGGSCCEDGCSCSGGCDGQS